MLTDVELQNSLRTLYSRLGLALMEDGSFEVDSLGLVLFIEEIEKKFQIEVTAIDLDLQSARTHPFWMELISRKTRENSKI